ncbi:hypothetical protein Dsin_026347 [Dipteronia sinensis]|uniref:Pectinesterase n=1 Tax=Dipteronia sinensis TaxID=43782 RepID=A0AAD9ZXG5_9ROSI|nr:hypothetical protein Dsin_026347 [Dipteronia sinensis]
MSNNVSKLISNTLSLNKVTYKPPSFKDGFPFWVKPGDRKLLQTPSPASRANIVVAKDGSGNFKTIKEAVTAASKRSGTGRYVIYIKSGTYNENIELGTKLKNIMFLGDGMGTTIVTGSRSVGGGSTTFKSATVGNLINPAGWMEWSGNFALNTLYYAEYANTGPGSSTANRVKWRGHHVLTSATDANKFTVENFLAGSSWLPTTGVPFTPGL